MPLILPVRQVLRRQPQGLVQLDPRNRTARDLGALAVGAYGYDFVNHRHGTTSGSPGYVTSALYGVGRYYDRNSPSKDAYAPATFSGDFTIFLVGGLTSVTAAFHIAVALLAGGTARCWLGNRSTSGMAFVTEPSGGSAVAIGGGGRGDAVYVGRLAGTTMQFFRNGVSLGTATQSTTNWGTVTAFEVGSTSFGSSPFANAYLAGFAPRAWSDDEVAEFSANPWALFKAPPRMVYLANVGGALALSPADLAHETAVDGAALGQTHLLAAGDLAHETALDGIGLAQTHLLDADDLDHQTALEGATLGQVHLLTIADLASLLAIDVATLAQTHLLVVDDLDHAHTLDASGFIAGIGVAGDDMVHAAAIDAGSFAQTHLLQVADLVHLAQLDPAVLSQIHQLAADGLVLVSELGPAALQQAHLLAALDLVHELTIGMAGFADQLLPGGLCVTMSDAPLLDTDLSDAPLLDTTLGDALVCD